MKKAELMQRVMAVPLGHELRVSYGDMWRAAGDGEVASREQVKAFVQQITRSWGSDCDQQYFCWLLRPAARASQEVSHDRDE